MARSVFSWFESRIDPFSGGGNVRPPDRLFAFYWHFVRQAWPVFIALLVAGFLGAVIEAALMQFVGNIVDMMRQAKNPETFFADHGTTLLFMAFVAMIARPIVSAAHDLIKNQVIAGPFTTLIRWQTHTYVLRQSLAFFQNDFAGRVANKVMQTGPAVRLSVVNSIDTVWFVGIYCVTAMIMFAGADSRLIGPLVLWLVVYAVALRHFVPRIRERSVASSEARSMLTGRIVDSYTNIQTVKLFAHTDREDEYAKSALREQLDAWLRSLELITVMEFVLYAMNGVLLVSMTALALLLWSYNAVTIGDIALVSGLTIRIVSMSGWVMFTITDIFENIGIAQEGMETISRPQAVTDRADAKPLAVENGAIRFENVHFDYGNLKDPNDELPGGVIDALSLSIAPGEKVGLVGRSGAGKSTLVSLLLRFYDLEHGRILVDGQDIAHVTQDSLRSQIGLVTQDTSLLHRSVIDNILYGRPDATDAAAIAAARRAAAHDFIGGLHDLRGRTGYRAQVGERGVKLSGGQRQRIAIARVLLKNAPILILDEATSALDSEVEAAIQEQLMNLMEGKTVIAIAHRLSTIAAMDRLVIMDRGRIVEEGRHGDLLKRGGLYADLWARQSGGFLAREAAE
jgi:ATP-binding cassette subfamily B multidrug efflux pump